MTHNIHWETVRKSSNKLDNLSHIWRIPLDLPASEINDFRQILSADEIKRAERFHFEKHRIRYFAARGFLRGILGFYLGISGSEVNFEYGEYGKPALPGNPLYFNLSHSHYMAVLGVYKHSPVGIDIEWIHRRIDLLNIAKRFFAPAEYIELASLPVQFQREGFFNCWTRKEAYIKADGGGLQIPLHQFEVTLKPGESPLLKSSSHKPENSELLKMISFNIGDDYKAAYIVNKKEVGQKYIDAPSLKILRQIKF
jgi:4'-phosphopantetheinyl transferase